MCLIKFEARRTCAFTPLLVLNLMVFVLTFGVFWLSSTLGVFIPTLLLLVYDVYRYDRTIERDTP